jgi:hypothetical protein
MIITISTKQPVTFETVFGGGDLKSRKTRGDKMTPWFQQYKQDFKRNFLYQRNVLCLKLWKNVINYCRLTDWETSKLEISISTNFMSFERELRDIWKIVFCNRQIFYGAWQQKIAVTNGQYDERWTGWLCLTKGSRLCFIKGSRLGWIKKWPKNNAWSSLLDFRSLDLLCDKNDNMLLKIHRFVWINEDIKTSFFLNYNFVTLIYVEERLHTKMIYWFKTQEQ